jgi:hypothetical protein
MSITYHVEIKVVVQTMKTPTRDIRSRLKAEEGGGLLLKKNTAANRCTFTITPSL